MKRDPRWPECCNQPHGICPVMNSVVCPFVNHKQRRDRLWAALPRCTECGGGEQATRHVASCHPEWHPFAHPRGLHGRSDLDRAHIPRCDARDGGYCFDSWCQCWCHKALCPNCWRERGHSGSCGSDLDRHADANAALAGLFRRALVFDSHTDV